MMMFIEILRYGLVSVLVHPNDCLLPMIAMSHFGFYGFFKKIEGTDGIMCISVVFFSVGLRRRSHPANNRVKQMFELSMGKERAATVLQELCPSNTQPLIDVGDDKSSLSSFTTSERVFLGMKPEGICSSCVSFVVF